MSAVEIARPENAVNLAAVPDDMNLWNAVSAQSWRVVAERVCAEYGATLEEVLTKAKSRRVSHARHAVIWHLRQPSPSGYRRSLMRVARLLNMKEHTGVLHGERAHQARMEARADG